MQKHQLIGVFICLDAYNCLIRHDREYSLITRMGAGILALFVQIGTIGSPVIGTCIPNKWHLVYKILLGSVIGMTFSIMKDMFTNTMRQREIQEIKNKQQVHDQRLSNHDQRLSNHDQRLSNHDQRLSNHDQRHDKHEQRLSNHDQRHDKHEQHGAKQDRRLSDLEFYQPIAYEPYDPPSPKA